MTKTPSRFVICYGNGAYIATLPADTSAIEASQRIAKEAEASRKDVFLYELKAIATAHVSVMNYVAPPEVVKRSF